MVQNIACLLTETGDVGSCPPRGQMVFFIDLSWQYIRSYECTLYVTLCFLLRCFSSWIDEIDFIVKRNIKFIVLTHLFIMSFICGRKFCHRRKTVIQIIRPVRISMTNWWYAQIISLFAKLNNIELLCTSCMYEFLCKNIFHHCHEKHFIFDKLLKIISCWTVERIFIYCIFNDPSLCCQYT